MLTAPTSQTIARQMTDPKVCCTGGLLCGELAGFGFGIFKGAKVTSCTCASCLQECCCCCGPDCGIKFGTMTLKVCACSGITTGMAVAGGLAGALTFGSIGYMCANQEQRSRFLSSDVCMLAKLLCDLKDPFSDTHSSCPVDQEESAPVEDSAVIDIVPLPQDTLLPASPDSMAPPPYPPTYENLNHAPPTYEEALNSQHDGARD